MRDKVDDKHHPVSPLQALCVHSFAETANILRHVAFLAAFYCSSGGAARPGREGTRDSAVYVFITIRLPIL